MTQCNPTTVQVWTLDRRRRGRCWTLVSAQVLVADADGPAAATMIDDASSMTTAATPRPALDGRRPIWPPDGGTVILAAASHGVLYEVSRVTQLFCRFPVDQSRMLADERRDQRRY